MRHFSIPLELEALIYIQARSLPDAQSKLDAVLSKSIDACDMRWFSSAPFGSRYRPELAFDTELRVRHRQPDEPLQEIEICDIWHSMRSSEENAKHRVIPMSRDWYAEVKLPIYAANVVMRTACLVQAISPDDARVFVEHVKGKRLDRYEDDRVFWDYTFPGASQIVLSPNMFVARLAEAIVRDQDQLRLIYTGDPNAVLSNQPESFSGYDREIHAVAACVRGTLRHIERGFEKMTDHNAHEIASWLIKYRNRKVGKPTRRALGD